MSQARPPHLPATGETRHEGSRRVRGSLAFTVLTVGGVAAAFVLGPSVDVALAAGAAWIVFLLLVVAVADLLELARGTRSPRYHRWLPEWRLEGWLNPVRSSFVLVAFFYGIVIGHFFWR